MAGQTCDYAACHTAASARSGQWVFCAPHLIEHQELMGLERPPAGLNVPEQSTPGRRPTAPCGTAAAYVRHLRHQEPTCQPCRDAWRQRCLEKAARRRARAAT
jgi:hypothetical protein